MAENDNEGFPYPLPLSDEAAVTLTNSLTFIKELNEEAGRIKRSREPTSSAVIPDDVLKSWFTYSTKVIPGGILTIVDTITVPTPRGMQTISRAKIDQVFDRRYLLELEPSEVLQEYTYVELDQLRFSFAAMLELINSGKVYGKDGALTGLARRDIKKNCSPNAIAAAADDEAAPAPPTAAPVQKNLRGVLEDECSARWPHTPVNKSCVFKVEQDPKQPRHKPLFQATVELPMLKQTFKGEWVGIKRDAESSAADAALRAFHSGRKK